MNPEALSNPPANPPQVIDGFTTPSPITLGQIALLEKIKSPLVAANAPCELLDLLPSLYLLSMSAREGLEHLPTLQADALAWADTLSHQQAIEATQKAQAALQAFFTALPRETEEDKATAPKKA